jgi:hypothetical protein
MIPIAIFSTDREAPAAASSVLAGTGAAVAQLARLSGAASVRSDAILRAMDVSSAGAGNRAGASATPYLATDEGNAALQKLLNAGLARLHQFLEGAKL